MNTNEITLRNYMKLKAIYTNLDKAYEEYCENKYCTIREYCKLLLNYKDVSNTDDSIILLNMLRTVLNIKGDSIEKEIDTYRDKIVKLSEILSLNIDSLDNIKSIEEIINGSRKNLPLLLEDLKPTRLENTVKYLSWKDMLENYGTIGEIFTSNSAIKTIKTDGKTYLFLIDGMTSSEILTKGTEEIINFMDYSMEAVRLKYSEELKQKDLFPMLILTSDCYNKARKYTTLNTVNKFRYEHGSGFNRVKLGDSHMNIVLI